MIIWRPKDIEAVGIFEVVGIAVCGSPHDDYMRVLGYGHPVAEINLRHVVEPSQLDRRLISKTFLDELRNQGRIIQDQQELLRVLAKGTQLRRFLRRSRRQPDAG